MQTDAQFVRTPKGSPIDRTGRARTVGPRRGHLSIVTETDARGFGPQRGHLSIATETDARVPDPAGSPVDSIQTIACKQTRSSFGPRRGHLSIEQDVPERSDPGGVTYR